MIVVERAHPVDNGIKIIKNTTLAQGKDSIRRNKDFEYSKVDLIAVKKMYDNDSYCISAINKYVELIFKRGWFLDSSNAEAKRYIKTRLDIMYKATDIKFDEILEDVTRSLVVYANAFAKKIFKPTHEAAAYTPLKHKAPSTLVALFTLHPASMYVKRSKTNNVLKWQQRDIGLARRLYNGAHHIPDQPEDRKRWPTYWPEEVIHVCMNREPGYVFGFSSLHTVIEDITDLRALEEHSSRLIYRDLFPLYHTKVGLPEAGLGASEEEVEEVKETIGGLSYDSVLVTNERVEVDVIGSKNEAIDPTPVLEHFERRCFTGLNVSPVQMGRDTSNRATADALTSEMHDKAEAYQNKVSLFAEKLFDILLLEGGFDITDETNKVRLKFPEIELETVIKRDNNTIQKWINNTITMPEMRRELGLDALTDEESNQLFSSYIQSNSADYGSQDNANQPENQYKKRSGPKRDTEKYNSILDNILEAINYNVTGKNIIEQIKDTEILITNTMSTIFKIDQKLLKLYNRQYTAEYIIDIYNICGSNNIKDYLFCMAKELYNLCIALTLTIRETKDIYISKCEYCGGVDKDISITDINNIKLPPYNTDCKCKIRSVTVNE